MSERSPEPVLVECANCRRQVPEGSFCGHCGASLSTGTALNRRHAYAASPAESVYHVGLATTLFPHLSRGRGALFAWCLLAGVALTVVLVALNLFPAAAAVAVLLLPVLYLLYLYEARIYADRPWLVVGLAFGLPLVLGVILTLLLGTVITGLALAGDWSLLLLLELIVDPVLALLATLVAPLLLLSRRGFDDVLDAVTFGSTSGLAFALGQTGVAVFNATFLPQGGRALRARVAVVAATKNRVSVTVVGIDPWAPKAPNGIPESPQFDAALSEFQWPS